MSQAAPRIRLATAEDAESIRAIYAPVVAGTAISFEVEPPNAPEMRRRLVETLARTPWLVCAAAGVGVAQEFAGPHRARPAYQWSVDVSVYVDARARRAGVACALYTSLFPLLALQGFCAAYAGITLPNPASVGLHESLGFRPVGVYRAVGYKLGAWHDVGWWELALRPRPAEPRAPVDLATARRMAGWEAALAAGLPRLRPR